MDQHSIDSWQRQPQTIDMASTDPLDTSAVAELAGVTAETIRQYLLLGKIPEPDGYLGRSPYWRRRTIERWLAKREADPDGRRRPRKKATEK